MEEKACYKVVQSIKIAKVDGFGKDEYYYLLKNLDSGEEVMLAGASENLFTEAYHLPQDYNLGDEFVAEDHFWESAGNQ